MPENNVVSYNAMLSGYLWIGDFMSARKVFDEMGERNIVSWNTMINGYLKVGRMRYLDTPDQELNKVRLRSGADIKRKLTWYDLVSLGVGGVGGMCCKMNLQQVKMQWNSED
ncbi:hypothetical protein CQW23_31749 [Capsicum baccatum]|uniref:Pentatricopeptide repeat-containing protein n=1 Tax=Capsicum baccatum TaxID=33114 RepID=A0A2G2V6K2_CAPBA|nr:hypothetical protein CQW23_31749 [Capsicum baccatum]